MDSLSEENNLNKKKMSLDEKNSTISKESIKKETIKTKSLHLIKSKIKEKYKIRKTDIYFPHELYATQKKYISKLISNYIEK